MHELGVLKNTLKTIDEYKINNGIEKIDTIVLEVGEMNDVVPKFLEEAWEVLKETSGYTNTKLQVNVVTAKATCQNCGFTDDVRNIDIVCPRCSSTDLKITAGKDFYIKELVVEE